MLPKDLYTSIQYVSAITEIARENGIKLEIGSDFETFRNALSAHPDMPPLYPMFDPAASYVDWTNGLWILGTDEKGEIVHTQAMRRIDMSQTTLAEHMQLHRRKYVIQGAAIDPDLSLYAKGSAWHNIRGNVCYHGQLWLKGGPGGYRGKGMTTILPRLAMALGHMQWSPDYVFGFMTPRAACGGLSAREGYMHFEPGIWRVPGDSKPHETWMVWMGREDLDQLLRFPAHELYEKLVEPEKRKLEEVPRPLVNGRAAAYA
ncbi:MAG: hypothetical protein WD489_04530 [Rhodovibrionaceae bacterium]